jgi:hypothetical protein
MKSVAVAENIGFLHVVPGGQEFPAHGSDEPEIKNTITFYFYFEKILIFSH